MVYLILIRHGESIWNLENRFTGWTNVSLSKKGLREAKIAGIKLKDYKFDIAYASRLIRAQQTLFEILDRNEYTNKFYAVDKEEKNKWYLKFFHREEDKDLLKIIIAEELNERYYGDLQGHNKDEMRKKYGKEQVHLWRRSYDIAPPQGESLKDTCKRAVPFFKRHILKDIKNGKNVIVSAHGNSLRAIIKHLENISDKDIPNLELKTGAPIIYKFNKNLKILKKEIL